MKPVAKPAMSELAFVILGGSLIGLGPISMALYTPAMPTLVEAFSTDVAHVKLTLSAYFLGFASAQLICGPLSDGFGRRPVLLIFLLTYVVASCAAALAPTIEFMIVARLVQGIGAAAGVSIARAVVRDLYTGQASARILSAMAMILALGPAVSPTIGGVTLELFSWEAIFFLMIAFGTLLLVSAVWLLPETNVLRSLSLVRPREIAVNYFGLLIDLRFMRSALPLGMVVGSFYSLATILPFVIIEAIGLTPTEFGYAMVLQSAAFLSGSFIASRVLRSFSPALLVPVGFSLVTAGCISMAGLPIVLQPNLWTTMVPVALSSFGCAFLMPSLMTSGMGPYPKLAGTAAALMGFLQIGSGVLGSLAATLFTDPITALMIVVPTKLLIAISFYFVAGLLLSAGGHAET